MMNPNRPTPEWDRGCLEEWRNGHSKERRAADAKALAEFFKLADKIPQMKEALDWAKAHGIEFVVDRTASVNGYYTRGSGVVALSAKVLKNPGTAVGTVSHEIRHAWQDWYGMLSHPVGRFSDFFPTIVLVEADAEAFGARARMQYGLREQQEKLQRGLYKLMPPKKHIAHLEQRIAALQNNPEELWNGFKGWFRTGRAAGYGDRAMKELGKELGIPGVERVDAKFEFRAFGDKDPPEPPPYDFTCDEQLRRLGKGFGNARNYFNGKARRDELRGVFKPDLCERFYNSARARPKMMDEIRRRALLLKLEKTRGRRLPLPA